MRPSILIAMMLTISVSCSTRLGNRNDNSTDGANNLSTSSPAATPQDETYSVVLSIPTGSSGITYENTDVDELEPWGPSAISLAPDGTFLILDSAANKVLRFHPDGTQASTITVDGVVGMTDVTANDSRIYVLDEGAEIPTVVGLTTEGRVEERRLLTSQVLGGGLRARDFRRSLSGVTTAEDGSVLLEFHGDPTRGLDHRSALDRSLSGRLYSVSVPTLQNQVSEGGRGLVLLNGQRFVEIKVDNLVAEMKVLAASADGDVYVVLDELTATPRVTVDQTVRRYRADGTLTGIARVPISEMYTYVEHNVIVDRDGQVFALLPHKGRNTEVVRLNFEPELQPILPKSSVNPDAVTASSTCTLTRSQIGATAARYLNNETRLNVANLDGACDGRKKPRYLGATAGQYPSVPYDWGGSSSVATYNADIANNKAAGDIDTQGIEECSTGVDCSGFVSRCWGFKEPDRFETATLPNVSTEIYVLHLQSGDILNFPKKHVVLFDRFTNTPGGNGVMDWESTTTNNVDRVVYRRSSWRRLLGYVARRYKQVC